MKTLQFRSLSDVLVLVDNEPMAGIIFTKEEYPWGVDSSCIVLDVPEEEYNPKGGTDFTEANGLKRALTIEYAMQIVYYARQQVTNPSPQQLVDSFNYYYKYDAFLNLM